MFCFTIDRLEIRQQMKCIEKLGHFGFETKKKINNQRERERERFSIQMGPIRTNWEPILNRQTVIKFNKIMEQMSHHILVSTISNDHIKILARFSSQHSAAMFKRKRWYNSHRMVCVCLFCFCGAWNCSLRRNTGTSDIYTLNELVRLNYYPNALIMIHDLFIWRVMW